MRRDLRELADGSRDLLVIGGGIHGACAAWDAVLRGLSVALVDRGDFGAATSANSLKIIHGGVRYLQQANVVRLRESLVERSIFLRIAPHLVRPLPVLVPTYGHGREGRAAFGAALRMADLVGFDRNRHLLPERRIAAGRVLSREECLKVFGGFDLRGLSGGALWYDALALDPERLTLAFLLSAAERGAAVANYARVERLLSRDGVVRGARIVDGLTAEAFEIRARMVLNATGPWCDEIAATAVPGERRSSSARPMALAVNLVTRPLVGSVAIGIRSRAGPDRDPVGGGHRFRFLVPWRDRTLVGTFYRLLPGPAGACRVTEDDLQALLDEVNEACPALGLELDEVSFYHRGLLPLRGAPGRRPDSLADRARIVDHEAEDGLRGLVSVMGTKYTTARRVARDAVDLVVARLGQRPTASRTADLPVYGAEPPRASTEELRDPGGAALSRPACERLARVHGHRTADVVAAMGAEAGWSEPVSPGAEVLRAEIVHAVRSEMALTLGDVVFRRTGMGTERCPPRAQLTAVAEVMAGELGWDAGRRAAEIADVLEAYEPLPRGPLA